MNQRINQKFVLQAFLFTFLIFGGSSWGSQTETTFGFTGGVSSFAYRIDGTEQNSISDGKGVYAGFFAEIPLVGSLYLVPSAYHTSKVSTWRELVSTQPGITTSSSYVETAAQVRWFFWDSPNWRAYLGVGPGYGILLSAEESQNGDKTDITRTMARNDLSIQAGAGLEFPFSSNVGMQLGLTLSKTFTNNLNTEPVRGPETHWEGAYLFAAWRFKSQQQEATTARDRAEEYLKFKNPQTSSPAESDGFN